MFLAETHRVAKLPKRRRIPKQRRSSVTVDAILQAAHELLEQHGPRGLTTNAVAERAGLGIASVYRYFPDRDAIVVELCRAELQPHAAHHQRLLARDEEAIASYREIPLVERLRFVCDRSVRVQRNLARLLGREYYALYFRAVSESSGVTSPESIRLIELVLEGRWEEAPLGDRALAPQLLHCLISGGVATLVSYANEETSDDSLVEEVLGMALRYLGAR